MEKFLRCGRKIWCFVIGRNTYEVIKKFYQGYGFDDLEGIKIIVSGNPDYMPPQGFLHALSPSDAIYKASDNRLSTLLLTGGPILNSHFLNEGLVQEIWINVEPALIGKGQNLVTSMLEDHRLEFIACEQIEDSIIKLRYSVCQKTQTI